MKGFPPGFRVAHIVQNCSVPFKKRLVPAHLGPGICSLFLRHRSVDRDLIEGFRPTIGEMLDSPACRCERLMARLFFSLRAAVLEESLSFLRVL